MVSEAERARAAPRNEGETEKEREKGEKIDERVEALKGRVGSLTQQLKSSQVSS